MNEHLIAWLFAGILLILLAASGITHALIARRGTTPTLLNLRARVHAWWLMSAVLAAPLPSVAAARFSCSGWCPSSPCANSSRWSIAAAAITA